MTLTSQSLEAVFDVLEKHGIKPRLDGSAELLERNNDWSQYTEAAETIARYKSQKAGEMDDYRENEQQLSRIGSGGFSRIGQILQIAKSE